MKTSVKAIFAGFGSWIIFCLILFLLNLLKANLIDFNNAFYDKDDNSILIEDIFYYFFQMIRFFGFIITGYVSARVARKSEMRHGVIIGVVIWTFSLAVLLSITYLTPLRTYQEEDVFTPMLLLNSMLIIIGSVLGAFIQKRIREKKEEKIESLENKIDLLGEE